ncbi:MAG TPA: biotin transporter BioY [Xanthobacteraceae bacterium]|nr:biotin transporter BioY [Xanthobacteraceae bacterium]
MTDAATESAADFSPLRLQARPLGVQIAAIVAGSLLLALSSHVSVPMIPVPITMQTFAVTLVGALYGWRLGAITILVWLIEGAAGLPVLAPGGATGIARFAGPTAGYLLAFPLAGAAVGWLAERGWNGRRPFLAFAAMLIGNALCLLLGAAWLATIVGVERAIAAGVTPFILGGVLKSALGAAALRAFTPVRSA